MILSGIYPWDSEGNRLCRILGDPDLIKAVFAPGTKRYGLRGLFGNVASQLRHLPEFEAIAGRRNLPVQKDDVAALVIRVVLASPEGRRELAKHANDFDSDKPFHQGLARTFGNVLEKDITSRFRRFCDTREDAFFLNLAKFEAWLSASAFPRDSLGHLPSLALLGAAFGILQPEIAPAIVGILVRRDERIAPWLVDDRYPVDHVEALKAIGFEPQEWEEATGSTSSSDGSNKRGTSSTDAEVIMSGSHDSLADFRRRAETLRLDAEKLAYRMQSAATELSLRGQPPDGALSQELDAYRNRWAALLRDIETSDYLQPLVPPRSVSQIADLTSLVTLLESVVKALADQSRRETSLAQGLTVLDRIESLTATDAAAAALLDEVRQFASRQRDLVMARGEESESTIADLAKGQSVLCGILSIVVSGDDVTAEHLDSQENLIEKAFSKPLVRALWSRRIRAPVPADKSASSPLPATTASPQSTGAGDKTAPLAPLKSPAPSEPTDQLLSGPSRSPSDASVDVASYGLVAAPGPIMDVAKLSVSTNEALLTSPAVKQLTAPPIRKGPLLRLGDHAKEDDKPSYTAQPDLDGARAIEAATASLSQLAAWAEAASEADQVGGLLHLVLGFVRDNRLCYAVHLAEHIEAAATARGDTHPPVTVPSAVLRSLAISPHLGASFGDLSTTLTDSLLQLYDVLSGSAPALLDIQDLHLLTFAAVLRPALIGPTNDAVDMLRTIRLPDGFDALDELRNTITEFSRFGSRVSPRLLKGLVEHNLWQSQIDDHSAKAHSWLQHSRQCTIIYAPATDVWHTWLADDGALGSMLRCVIHKHREGADDVVRVLQRWAEPTTVADELKRTDREIRGRKADLRPIEARAASGLRKKVCEAVGFGKTWLRLLEQEPAHVENYTLNTIAKCRNEALRCLGPIREALATAERYHGLGVGRQAALVALRRAIDGIQELFDPEESDEDNRSVEDILNAELLLLPDLQLDDGWRPVRPMEKGVARALILAARATLAWEPAFREHCKCENLKSAQAILDLASHGVLQISDTGTLERELQEQMRESLASLKAATEVLERTAQRAVFDGALSHSEFQDVVARLEALRPQANMDLRPVRGELDAIKGELASARQRHIADVLDHMNTLRVEQDAPIVANRIRLLLDDGDVRTALEFLALNEQGHPLPEDTDRQKALFFPDFVEQAEAVFQGRQVIVPETVNAIRDRKPIGNLSASNLPPPQTKEVADMLESWLQACNKCNAIRAKVGDILKGLGFEDVEVKQAGDKVRGNHCWLQAKVRPLADRDICPIPQFGSDARGYYRLLLLWGKPLEGDIVTLAGGEQHHGPVIALFFGQMSTGRRRDLAHRCRRENRPLLLIDEYLLLFAAREGERRDRLARVFDGAMQFSAGEPFTTTAGYVPSEMFYGRTDELQRLAAPNNYHLVFGGRQLGKTALLRHLERMCHLPEMGRIVRWIDMTNQYGIGLSRPISDIWLVISQVLNQFDIVPKGTTTPDTIERHVAGWLGADRSRQIVLLLDEADLFLDSDSRGEDSRSGDRGAWVHTRRMKALCENTERRFKFVLAGLHNVQRSSRDPNSPIAHLGTAVCIGPFLSREEMTEARELIRRPFEALGYRFASPDLIMRILAYTNYYPSLIQLFCKHLLEYLSGERPAFNQRHTPPYEITARHIEDAYQSRTLHNEIVDRFTWTLRLDERYRLIALLLAHNVLSDGAGNRLSQGLSLAQIRQDALSLWPRGFTADSSMDGFQTIVDEMIGLGVLREVGRGRYSFRSPNVVKMLGTDEQIFDALLQVSAAEPQIQYQASTFRRADPGAPWHRSPLSAQQEGALRSFDAQFGVSFIFGSRLSGIEEVLAFLRMIEHETTEVEIRELVGLTTLNDFMKALDDNLADVKEGVTMLVTPCGCPWDWPWVSHGYDRLNRRRGAKRRINMIFLADPGQTWHYLSKGQSGVDGPADHVTQTEMSLKPWSDEAVRRLLDAIGVVHDPAKRQRISDVTGGWHSLVQDIARRCSAEPNKLDSYIDELAESLHGESAWGDSLALPDELRPLLKMIAELAPDPVSVDDLTTLAPEVGDEHQIVTALTWADLLQYVQPMGPDKWVLNPLVARLLLS